MKKMLSLAIALALCFSLCACVGNAPQGKSALDWDAMQEELQASSEVLTAQLTNFAFYSGDILGSSAYPLEDRQIHLFILSNIVPLASAKTEDEVIKLFHYTNLQPLWAEENLRKSDKVTD